VAARKKKTAMADSMKVRTGIGLCLIAGISGLMYLDHSTGHGWGAIALSIALTGLALWEYARMTGAFGVPMKTLIVFGLAYTTVKGLSYEVDPKFAQLLGPIAILFMYGVFFSLLRGAPSKKRFHGMTATAFGFFYIPFLAGFSLDARFIETGLQGVPVGVGEAAFYYVIAIAKGTDIFAYFFGKTMGRRKIIPSVSPGKTGAGFVGALVGGTVITAGFCHFTSLGSVLPMPLSPGVGIVMALVGISGDLIESFIKRSVEVKDSAQLLPNFGGVLDIIDSILIASPPVFFLLIGLLAVRA
jgi:phosphatidate cytidylyltransferase